MTISEAPEVLEEICYTFIIQTGSNIPSKTKTQKWSDGTMILNINPGSDNQSPPIKVKECFPMETEGAVTVDFWLPATVGVPKLLKVDLESNKLEIIKDALFVRQITVTYNRHPYRFPIKNYVYPHNPMRGNPTVAEMGCPPHFLVREGAGTLKHLETEEFIINAREEDLETIQSMVDWYHPKKARPGFLLPGFFGTMNYSKLPRFLQFREAQMEAFEELRKPVREEVRNNVVHNMKDKLLGTYKEEWFPSFEHYAEFVKETAAGMGWAKETVFETMKLAKIFRSDEEFGRQMLVSPNGLQIRKVTSLDKRWADRTVPEYALEGKSVQEVIEEGHLFEILNDDLLGVPHGGSRSKELTGTKQTWYVVLADCLFYQTSEGKIVPVLIRLENRNDKEPATFWAPPSPEITDLEHPKHLSWLYAKMWFRCADANVQTFSKHFARAHATNEMFAVAIYRNLPNAHPMFRLLQPHIQGIIPINVQARNVLINPGKNVVSMYLSGGDGLAVVLTNYYKRFTYQNLVLPDEIKSRGVEDIPDYLFRDDILYYWEVIGNYTRKMVDLAYPSEEDVAKDSELQNVFKDVVDFGLRGFEDGAGFPKVISGKEKLIEYLTAIIINISVFHSAVNFQTFTSYAFTPNAPTYLSSPPPKQDQQITKEEILKSLPVKEVSFITMAVCLVLGSYSPIERLYLGSPSENKLGIFGENMAVAPEQEDFIHELVEDMRRLKRKIDARNVGRYLKYDVMSPVNTPITTQI
ncbi:polyunsaturated fatty acid 5-lipoxygenase-like [Bolinopsis microptera]|uniref:polyunsaturated fatty acid 5-lipoxygenase-like n=1 Tax=Bolinopsis microptera TaxID=2820187 RepID=UPI00307AD262